MLKNDCIFCKIIKSEIPTHIIYQNDYVLVIKDIAPKAPIHYLIIPKTHFDNLKDFKNEDEMYLVECAKAAKYIAKDLDKDFNLISNNGRNSGQTIFHMHWHFIADKNLIKSLGL